MFAELNSWHMHQKFWDNLAAEYNTEIFDVLQNDKNGVIKANLKRIASKRKTIADIGCAVGKWLPLLSAGFKKVHAIDFSKLLLDEAEEKYRDLTNVAYSQVDFTKPYQPAEKFEAALCVNAILTDSAPKRDIFFKNIAGCLRKHGDLLLVVPSFESFAYKEAVVRLLKREQGKQFKETPYRETRNRPYNMMEGHFELDSTPTKHHLREELIFTLERLGFDIISIDKAEYEWTTEFFNPPKSLGAPYPWDWVVLAKKNR